MNDSVNSLNLADLVQVQDLIRHPAYPHLKALLRADERRVRGEPASEAWALKAAYTTGKLDGYEKVGFALDNLDKTVQKFIDQLEKAMQKK